jgi:outer membrane protein OmpA-like peptidoglycan-associated protein
MSKEILTILFILTSSLLYGQLKLDLNDSTTFKPGFETSFDINYQDTFVFLDSSTSKTFESIVKFHKENPTFLLEIGVHQDQMGPDNFNLKQSEARARRIIDLLQKKYDVDMSKFIVIGYGESDPVLKFEEIGQYRFDEDNALLQNVANINRRLSLKILKIN